MTHFPGSGWPDQDPFDLLRHNLHTLRIAQAIGDVLALSRYDTDTHGINESFAGRVLDILPVTHRFFDSGNRGAAADFRVEDPINLRPLAAFGVFLHTHNSSDIGPANIAGHVIGQRVGQGADGQPDGRFTELLVATKKRQGDNTSATFYSAVVSSKLWAQYFSSRLDALRAPFDPRTANLTLEPGVSGHIVKQSPNHLGIATIQDQLSAGGRFDDTHIKWAKPRQLERALANPTFGGPSIMGGTEIRERALTWSDIVDFGVMTHLEGIAAAYEVGPQYDGAWAQREQELAAHPAQIDRIYGIAGIRAALETGSDSLFRPAALEQ